MCSSAGIHDDAESERADFYDNAQNFTPLVAVRTPYGLFLCRTGDNLGKSLFVNRLRPEMLVLDEAVGVLKALGLAAFVSGRVFIDGGANNGTATIAALLRHGFSSAVAVEPEPNNYQLLCLNLLSNGLMDRVVSVQAALTDANGQADLAVMTGRSGEHFLRSMSGAATNRLSFVEPEQWVVVRTVTLDCLAAEGFFDPAEVGLVWLDVQGYETHAMRGAEILVSAGIPAVLELWPAELRRLGVLDTLRDLAETNYTHVADLREPQPEITVRPVRSFMSLVEGVDELAGSEGFTDVLMLRLE